MDIPGEQRRVRWTLEGDVLKRWKMFVSEARFRKRGRICIDLEWPKKNSPLPRFALAALDDDNHRLGRKGH